MPYEDLHVQQAAALLREEVDGILKELRSSSITAGELDRAVESILLDAAEARGQRTAGQRCHFYGLARGSSDEARRCLRTLVRRDEITWKRAFRAIGLTYTIGKMLTALIKRITRDG